MQCWLAGCIAAEEEERDVQWIHSAIDNFPVGRRIGLGAMVIDQSDLKSNCLVRLGIYKLLR